MVPMLKVKACRMESTVRAGVCSVLGCMEEWLQNKVRATVTSLPNALSGAWIIRIQHLLTDSSKLSGLTERFKSTGWEIHGCCC